MTSSTTATSSSSYNQKNLVVNVEDMKLQRAFSLTQHVATNDIVGSVWLSHVDIMISISWNQEKCHHHNSKALQKKGFKLKKCIWCDIASVTCHCEKKLRWQQGDVAKVKWHWGDTWTWPVAVRWQMAEAVKLILSAATATTAILRIFSTYKISRILMLTVKGNR